MAQLIEFAFNHPVLVGAFFVILTVLLVNLVQGGGSKAVLPIQAVQLFNRQDAVPLDIRSAVDFEEGHIVNARNIPMAELKTGLNGLKKLKDKPVVVYCATGATTAAALRELSAAGFEQVYSLKGGIAAWRNDNLPLTRGR
jgi:rhodanese-related sulfurtransferase